MAIWGRVQAFLTGAAVSRASSDAVGPVMEPVRQRSSQRNAVRVLDPGTVAELIARLIVDEGEGQAEAQRSAINANRLQALTLLAQTWPGPGELDKLTNRELITTEEAIKALHRHGFPDELVGTVDNPGPLVRLFQDILTPGELAAAIHRGLVPDQGMLLGEQPQPPFKVEAYPVQPIDAIKEAAGSGYDKERLQVLVGLQGLPMGVIEAAHAYWRGIITHGDYIRAFNTSNSRNEWAQAVLEYSRQIPTARDFFENALRGHHTFEWAAEQAARHGMSAADSEVIYQNQGRPLNLHQITQALAWGAKYNPAPTDNPDPWFQSVLLGPVRPEYYDMNRVLKYNLPSAFYFRTLQEQGVLDQPSAETWYKRLGWPPELAALVAEAYSKTTAAAKEDPWLAKARQQWWTAAHKAFVKNDTPRDIIEPVMLTFVPDLADRDAIFRFWADERAVDAGVPPAP